MRCLHQQETDGHCMRNLLACQCGGSVTLATVDHPSLDRIDYLDLGLELDLDPVLDLDLDLDRIDYLDLDLDLELDPGLNLDLDRIGYLDLGRREGQNAQISKGYTRSQESQQLLQTMVLAS